MYAFNENFILPFSHDEVVHGKCSLITRMPGDYWRQFAGMRALAFYQMTHPGGKLNFMGNEIAQFIEWRYYEGIEYFLAQNYENHGQQQRFVAAINKFYNEHPALWQRAYEADGFEWIDADNADQCVISYVRHGDDPADDLVVLINFEVNPYEEYRIGVPRPGYWQEVFNTDAQEFGGSGVTNGKHKFRSTAKGWNNQADSIVLRVPPLGGTVLRYAGPLPKPRKKATTKKADKADAAAKAEATAPAKKTRARRTTKKADAE
jgi:1,4-alpha-glucan branching enzyme